MKRLVIKLGGSLFDGNHLSSWLNVITEHTAGQAIIIPGGGDFADRVRDSQQASGFDDLSAHRLALLAMVQSGHALMAKQPALQPAFSELDIEQCLQSKRVPVWLPLTLINDQTQIPASWNWTSDSIALWLACQLNADLCLVKSVTPVEPCYTADQLQQTGIVDNAFPLLLRQGMSDVHWLGPMQHAQFPDLQAGARVTSGSVVDQAGVPV